MTVEQAKQIIAQAQTALPTTAHGMEQLRKAVQFLAGQGLRVS